MHLVRGVQAGTVHPPIPRAESVCNSAAERSQGRSILSKLAKLQKTHNFAKLSIDGPYS